MNLYDKNSSFRLLQARLGNIPQETLPPTTIEGVNDQHIKLNYNGGLQQQNRMIKDKRRTLDRAVLYSYQGARIKKLGSENIVRALINPNKLKPDYDDKTLSVGFEHRFAPGDVFEWMNTGTYWLIYLQDLTELAYFHGDVRKCSYQISWEQDGKIYSTYMAIRGPVETKINSIQKHGISIDTPNYSLSILLPANENTLKYFNRYSKFYLKGAQGEESNVCWRVEARDTISMPGVIELTAVEYYANETEDDIENGIVGGLIVEPINPNPGMIEDLFEGETFIRPKKEYTYTFIGNQSGSWSVDSKLPVEIISMSDKSITIKWCTSYHGQFELKYGDYVKTVVAESLF